MMVDDFGRSGMGKLLFRNQEGVPRREPIELPLDHPIFHCVYDLKEKPQVPRSALPVRPCSGTYVERPDAKEVHYKGIFDDKGRMMVMIATTPTWVMAWEREGKTNGTSEVLGEESVSVGD